MPTRNNSPASSSNNGSQASNNQSRIQAVVNANATIFKGSETIYPATAPDASITPPLPSPRNQAPSQNNS